ncbi:MAG: head GIN domain-containing protein [Bacteroidota bacterium]
MKNSNKILLVGFIIVVIVSVGIVLRINSLVKSDAIKGTGVITEKTVEVPEFSKIIVNGKYNVSFTAENERSVQVFADENLHEYIVTVVRNDALVIESKDFIHSRNELEVNVSNPSLNEVMLNGAAKFSTTNDMNADQFSLTANAASEAELKGTFNKMVANQNAASSIILQGTTKMLSIESNAAGSVDASRMKAQNADVEANAAAEARVFADTLSAKATSAGKIRYLGNPVISTMDVNSAGNVRQINN